MVGFWLGLWHGIISLVTLIILIFWQGATIYEVHNNGLWYNLGFVLEAGILLGGSTVTRRQGRIAIRRSCPCGRLWEVRKG